jgi:N-acyl-L-homoserine lactone synthetase
MTYSNALSTQEINNNQIQVSYSDYSNAPRQIFTLRAAVFHQELGWVKNIKAGCEIDEFDHDAIHIDATSQQNEVVGTIRVLKNKHDWMMDKYFPFLVDENNPMIRNETSIEISRLAVCTASRTPDRKNSASVADMLIKSVIHYGITNGVTNLYAVVSDITLRFLRNVGFNCNAIGPSVVMPDGVCALAIRIDLREFIANRSNKYYKFYLEDTAQFIKTISPEKRDFIMRLALKEYQKFQNNLINNLDKQHQNYAG